MLEASAPSETFLGVRFVLFGFDPIYESQVRAKLLNGGGEDAGQYSQMCSHVIVDKIVHDDPISVAARNDGKTVVTALWVEHSCDIGMAVDVTSIMYRPLRDLNGIPGAKRLIMCLTGYQRQDRDDIMTMVSLMGAQFSKPLVANKVTHLICYKFEGEKYELAKKLKQIKLVNHHWLEDCLRDWELLPEDNYNRSGYEMEMEMMQAEAKDSEDDAEDIAVKQSTWQLTNKSPQLKIGTPKPCQLPKLAGELTNLPYNLGKPEGLHSVAKEDVLLASGGKNRTDASLGNECKFVPEILAHQVHGASNSTSVGLPDPQERIKNSMKERSDLESISRSAERPNSDAKSKALSYTRTTPRKSPRKSPQKSPSPILSGQLGNCRVSPRVLLGQSINKSSGEVEYSKDITGCAYADDKKRSEFIYGEASSSKKQKLNVSCSDPKPQNTNDDTKASVNGSPLVSCKQGLELASLVDGHSKSTTHSPPGSVKNNKPGNDIAMVDNAQKSPIDASPCKSSKFKKKPFTQSLLFPENAALEIEQNEEVNDKEPQTSSSGLRKSSLSVKPVERDFAVEKSEHMVAYAVTPQHQHQDKMVPYLSEGKTETEKCQTSASLEEHHQGNVNLTTKSVRRKTTARKTLGSRQKLNSTANQKGSIYLNKVAVQNDHAMGLSGQKADHETSANEFETPPETFNVSAVKEINKKDPMKSGNDIEINTDFMDDETEAPEDTDATNEVDKAITLSHEANNEMVVEQEEAAINNADADMEDCGKVEQEDAADLSQQKDESTCKVYGMKGKASKGKRQGLRKTTTKTKTVPDVPKQVECKEDSEGEENCEGIIEEKTIGKQKSKPCSKGKSKSETLARNKSENSMEAEKENKTKTAHDVPKQAECKEDSEEDNCEGNIEEKTIGKKKSKPCSKGISKSETLARKKSENSMKADKENRPIGEHQNSSQAEEAVGKTVLKSDEVSMKKKQKSLKKNQNCVPDVSKQVKTEPKRFIMSGHRLQRKEFQQVIRRLKGKVCSDTHHWSYQATHFIAPDPIRRTEKFFAAAASGRWILRTDYLTACCQEGKFLEEVPYEWHKNGLSEDGAISLEAPRKWRLLKEKTGHGAFHGLRIIIYGECITPPLDTLKRVVKAGDGMILATSPPYTRYLNSGVDYAIVSPGMPHVDMWVQEFLQHEVPCVVADYLVEYVCKPGYSLERHVLYNTNVWAEKSFAKLQSKAEEVIAELTPLSATCSSDDDIACEVCGCCDRGDVMLICGDEKGSVGCGKGMHMDCCDPPLKNIPEEDWFCPNCSGGTRKKSKSSGSSKRKR